MTPWARSPDQNQAALASARVASVARALGESHLARADGLGTELADSIPELRGDPIILDLLGSSTRSNLETFFHFAQHSIDVSEIGPPAAAVAYAQRLAQRGTASNALLRAYRIGQRRVIEMTFDELALQEDDPAVAYLAAQRFHELMSLYVDRVVEGVLDAYDAERERWLAHRNSVRATVLDTLLAGEEMDLAAAESGLGYRLRQHHLGLVVWEPGREESASVLHDLESLVSDLGEAVGAVGQPFFMPRDGSIGWAWIPLGQAASVIDRQAVERVVAQRRGRAQLAVGSARAGRPGLRGTHLEALRAQNVAQLAGSRANPVTWYEEPGVRLAAALAADLTAARELVADALGELGADDDGADRLRETLAVFLATGGSFIATAERIHVHKNTVKYRVDKALELRARPLDDDRLSLELALQARRWLGRSVLPH